MEASQDRSAFVITRQFSAPRDRVWKAWSEVDQLARWWGPKGCSVEVLHLDFRPGGLFHYRMQFEGAPPMWGRFNFQNIAAPERIVWLNSFANERCGIARAPFSEECPLEIRNSVEFTENAGTTTLAIRAQPFGASDAELQFFEQLCSSGSLDQGYGGTFEQLAAHLAAS
ncbi:MAG: SRPBCC domain-containing protein [Gammaproteobacteria bacterium]|nr:SRPBCC domain-containing protein [Gammaproteobacteria bacterium]